MGHNCEGRGHSLGNTKLFIEGALLPKIYFVSLHQLFGILKPEMARTGWSFGWQVFGSGAKFLICIYYSLSAIGLASARSFVYTGDISKPHSITQIKNPNWTPEEIPVPLVLAAPFRKHRIPMPPVLQKAVDDVETTSVPGRRLRTKPRATGQSVPGSSGQ